MSLKPAAEWLYVWQAAKYAALTPSLVEAIQANAMKAGREAGFREGIEAAADLVNGKSRLRPEGIHDAYSFASEAEAEIRALTCPPAADGSEGSDGDAG